MPRFQAVTPQAIGYSIRVQGPDFRLDGSLEDTDSYTVNTMMTAAPDQEKQNKGTGIKAHRKLHSNQGLD